MMERRIEILLGGGVISRTTADYALTSARILAHLHPEADAERAAGFITHLALAAERVLRQNAVEPMTREAWQQVKNSPEYVAALRLWDKLEEISPVSFPASEREYLFLYMCMMLE